MTGQSGEYTRTTRHASLRTATDRLTIGVPKMRSDAIRIEDLREFLRLADEAGLPAKARVTIVHDSATTGNRPWTIKSEETHDPEVWVEIDGEGR